MTPDETYDFIGNLAIALYAKGIRISLGSLRSVLADADRGNEYMSGRGMAAGVSAAYDLGRGKVIASWQRLLLTRIPTSTGI